MLQTKDTSPEIILQRIDAIIAEPQSLRQAVTTLQKQSSPPSPDIVYAFLDLWEAHDDKN